MRALPSMLLLMLLTTALAAGCLDEEPQDAPDEAMPAAVDTTPFEVQFNQGGVVAGAGGATTPANPDGCNALDEEGVDIVHHRWEAPAESNGTPLKVRSLTATLTLSDPSLLDADLDVLGPDGTLLGQTTDFNVQTGPQETFSTDAGLVPGEYTFAVRGCAGRGAYHLSVTFEMQAVPLETATTTSASNP